MSRRDANAALTGLFGAYASDDEGNSGSGEEEGAGGAGVVLLGAHGEAEPEDASDEQPGLSSLLSPGHLPEVASVAQLAPSASDQALAEVAAAAEADAAQQRSSASEPAGAAAARLPPELADPPPGADTIAKLHRARAASGKLLSAELRRHRDFRNPDFLQKMVDFHGIADAGSNFPTAAFDPAGFPKEDFYDELAKEWEAETQRRLAARNTGAPTQFRTGATELPKKPPGGLSIGASQAAIFAAQAKAAAMASSAGAKRSKWDSAPRR